MLFLAVTLGFFVENQREHYIEHRREKQFMVSLVEDLNEDILILDHQIRDNVDDVNRMDSLIILLYNDILSQHHNQLYYLGRIASRHDIFNYNNRTIDQMRNSGGFRLVQNQEVSTRIMGYYREIKILEMLEGVEKNEEQEYRKLAIRIFDPLIFDSMVNDQDSIVFTSGNPRLRTYNRDLLIDLAGWIQYMKSSVQGFIRIKRELKKLAETLVAVVKKEYHL
jgi:hypothetical protein